MKDSFSKKSRAGPVKANHLQMGQPQKLELLSRYNGFFFFEIKQSKLKKIRMYLVFISRTKDQDSLHCCLSLSFSHEYIYKYSLFSFPIGITCFIIHSSCHQALISFLMEVQDFTYSSFTYI